MSSPEEKNYIRLLMLSVDLSTDVIRAFTESKILCNYDNSFTNFLLAHKHDLFHAWIPNTHCCQCSSVTMGTALTKKIPEIDEAIFNKIFDKGGSTNLGHYKKGIHGSITQHCLCRLTPREGLRLEDVDINLLFSILYNCVKLQKQDFEMIRIIRQQRWEVYQGSTSRRCSDIEYNRIWSTIESALSGLVQDHFIPSYKRIVDRQIKLIKIADVDKVDVNELMEKLTFDKKFGQVLSTRMNGITNALRDEAMQRQCFNQANTSRHTDIHLDRLENKENSNKMRDIFSRSVRQVHFDIKHTALRSVVHQLGTPTGRKFCNFQLDTPTTWDTQQMVIIVNKIAPSLNREDQYFQIHAAKVGSLVIRTTANPNVLQDRETFRNAVESFLKKLVEVCEIDTSIPATVPVQIDIYGANFGDPHDTTSSDGIVEANGGDDSVQMNFAIGSQECQACKEKDELIERLLKEIHDKNAYIKELEKRLAEQSGRSFQGDATSEVKSEETTHQAQDSPQ